MTGFDICLIAIALVCIVASFMLSEKIDQGADANQVSEEMLATLLSHNQESMKESLDAYLHEVKEQVIEETIQELNKVSNEKIMAVDEFSNTVLEKINENHSETVFLYNMLNEKETDLKGMIGSIEKAKSVEQSQAPQNQAPQKESVSSQKATSKHSKNTKKSSGNNQIQKADNVSENREKGKNLRQEILELYEQGMSVVEIAQTLNKGQGEIKLFIDLYQGGMEQ